MFFLVSLFLFSNFAAQAPADAVLLADVKALTLYHGKLTTGRRSSPVPQLDCVGGTAKGESAKVDVVQCTNKGFDGNDYQWACTAQLPETLKLGRIEVVCEGYGYPDDPYILRGSCGLEYHLEYAQPPKRVQERVVPKQADDKELNKLVGLTLVFIFLCLSVFCLFLFFSTRTPYEPNYKRRITPPISSGPTSVIRHTPPTVIHHTPIIQSTPSTIIHHTPVIQTPLVQSYTPPILHTHTVVEDVPVEPQIKTSTAYGGTGRRSESPVREPVKTIEKENVESTSWGGTTRRKDDDSSWFGSSYDWGITSSSSSKTTSASTSSPSSETKSQSTSHGGTRRR